MAAEVGCSEGEESRIHGSLEEEKEDQDDDSSFAMGGDDDCVENNGADGVDHKQEVRLEDGCESGCYEAAHCKGDQGIGEHVRSLSGRESSVLGSVVDEEGSDSDLGSDVAELGDKSEDHVVLFVERALSNLVSELIEGEVLHSSR